jgi:hypothetical protein
MMSNEHYPGRCKGGPYDGKFIDYFQERMPVLSGSLSSGNNTGEYLFEPVEGKKEGLWLWRPLMRR